MGMSEAQIVQDYSTRLVKADEIGNELKLYQRSMHVYQEANRVFKFAEIANECVGGDQRPALQRLGHLMNESHESCRRQYECSCEELDNLVELQVKELGALGARLTGAGWGGCTVALVSQSQADDFLCKLQSKTKLAFASKPSPGAIVYVPNC